MKMDASISLLVVCSAEGIKPDVNAPHHRPVDWCKREKETYWGKSDQRHTKRRRENKSGNGTPTQQSERRVKKKKISSMIMEDNVFFLRFVRDMETVFTL
ncbi:Uncharacterised protein r2_g2893 [Pycnogonum litorale]